MPQKFQSTARNMQGGATPGLPERLGGRRLAAALILATIVVYIPALQGGFIWDDDDYVTENPTLHDLDGLRQIWLEPDALPQYYPLVHTTFWIEYHLWGLEPLGYHLVNVLLHILNALILWRILRELEVPGAALAAALFALHPVHVESVAWITERKNVLSGLLYLLAMWSYLRFDPLREGAARRFRPWRLYAVSFLLFLLALLSKTVACTLPAALLLLTWWKRGKISRRDVLPLALMLLAGIGFGLVTLSIEKDHVGAQGESWSLSLVERILIAGRALWFYASKLAWPADLAFIYPRWSIDSGTGWQYLYPGGFAGLVLLLWLLRRRVGRGPLVAVLFFAGTLVPALGFFDFYPMLYSYVADHFQYMASVGLLVLASAAYFRFVNRSGHTQGWVRLALPVLILGVLGILSWRQGHVYRDLETLWTDTLRKNPESWMAHNNLGLVFAEKGSLTEAMSHYRECLRIRPTFPEAHHNLGTALLRQGRMEEAAPAFAEALRLRPGFLEAHYNLALTLEGQGRLDEAVGHFEKTIALQPENAGARYHLAVALTRLGRIGPAIDQHREALRLSPDWTLPLNDLAWILATHPHPAFRNGAEALRLAERACRLEGYRDANALDTLAAALAELGRFEEAADTARRAVERAEAAGEYPLAAECRSRLRIYLEGRPHRERAPVPP